MKKDWFQQYGQIFPFLHLSLLLSIVDLIWLRTFIL
ncbi:TPA: hypothetical protein ACGO7A_000126 [Streptococcus suis]